MMLDVISVFLNLLRLVLWCSTSSILENVPYTLEKNVCSAVLGWNILCVSGLMGTYGVVLQNVFYFNYKLISSFDFGT